VFVHGCFWHRHADCPKATLPRRNRAFWAAKFAANVERDLRKAAELAKLGFRVFTVWECETVVESQLRAAVTPILLRHDAFKTVRGD
jgi:DNA mismatch endonuclease, patch repair protein